MIRGAILASVVSAIASWTEGTSLYPQLTGDNKVVLVSGFSSALQDCASAWVDAVAADATSITITDNLCSASDLSGMTAILTFTSADASSAAVCLDGSSVLISSAEFSAALASYYLSLKTAGTICASTTDGTADGADADAGSFAFSAPLLASIAALAIRIL